MFIFIGLPLDDHNTTYNTTVSLSVG